jgi:pSer/pThr/pTyr-binding forkhead associated (FHA) protein
VTYLGRRGAKNETHPDIDFSTDEGATFGVSRRHACIHRSAKNVFIEDLGSFNGTFLNGQRLQPSEKYPLAAGDVLHLGQLRLQFTLLPNTDDASHQESQPISQE